ncbi:hypothetical protein FSARC_10927 [Fusarium sarcochroum]|uniref:Xylanolytic transcriptional activator regulatory domain-containing protein n=1 Tax=Fusarium sarcochroum TaxID=1208366 RepID=A0A8H4TJ08_9HYPO|nr:hypothetical protein FSARC_10927 [Fusarium sarcochroum]
MSESQETGTVQPMIEDTLSSAWQKSILPPIPNTSLQTGHSNSLSPGANIDGFQTLDPPPDSNSNRRALGPILDSDSRVMVDCFPQSLSGHRVMKPAAPSLVARTSSALPVFVGARRRPAGLTDRSNPAQPNLKLIQKFLDPFIPNLVEILAFWKSDPVLAQERRPDERFIWNLASEALFSELRLCPGIYTIAAVLLNVGGRPSTLLFNNAGQLGFAVSVAFAMGLNRDPSSWDIPEQEKKLRRRVWWALLIHDRWSSFSCGTPPRIRSCQSNLPLPNLTLLSVSEPSEQQKAEVYAALASLTEVLYYYLEEIHQLLSPTVSSSTPLDNRARSWPETITGRIRRIVLRGLDMDTPGAANLRLAFLSIQFLHYRISLERSRCDDGEASSNRVKEIYIQTRRAAEDIVVFLEELSLVQLQDFWMPELASTLCFVMAFLIRATIEWEVVYAESTEIGALNLARTLIQTLRTHKQNGSWDIGYSCLEQYSELLEWLILQDASTGVSDVNFDTLDAFITDGGLQDALLFPMIFD